MPDLDLEGWHAANPDAPAGLLEAFAAYETALGSDDLAAMAGLKQCFDPSELFNPGKVFPSGRGCGELAALRRGGLSAADLAGVKSQSDVPRAAWL